MEIRDHIFAGGDWHPAADPSATIDVLEGRSGEVVGRVAAAGEVDVDLAVRAARAALPAWAAVDPAQRAELVAALGRALRPKLETLAELEAREIGTPIHENREAGVLPAILTLEGFPQHNAMIEYEERFSTATAVRDPRGVVGVIAPWNAPLLLTAIKVGSALCAGCTVVVKSSELAPLSTFAFADAALEVGLPAGVLNILTGFGPEAGEALVRHPGVDMISFTGSVPTARRIASLAAESIKPATFELGGKSASVILSDADMAAAIAGSITSAFHHNGQYCMGTTRFVVPRGRMDEATDVAEQVIDERFQLGDPLEEETRLGPLISARQQERVRGYIQRGIEEGARVAVGGADPVPGLEQGYYVAPTVFADTRNDMTIAREEIFGPVVCLIPYDDDDDAQALAIANDSTYGLGGSVWSSDADRAERVARGLQTGSVEINGAALDPLAPYGGVKSSGYGREGGRVGIEEFLTWKVLNR